ncbi:MAG: hypothetical protein SFX73_10545, partial [Kofleriaceae bacterium]|nr:hypothetical protein [Kofleriaceae bacterium]
RKATVVVYRWNGVAPDPVHFVRTTVARADDVAAALGARDGFWYGSRRDRRWLPQAQVERIHVRVE